MHTSQCKILRRLPGTCLAMYRSWSYQMHWAVRNFVVVVTIHRRKRKSELCNSCIRWFAIKATRMCHNQFLVSHTKKVDQGIWRWRSHEEARCEIKWECRYTHHSAVSTEQSKTQRLRITNKVLGAAQQGTRDTQTKNTVECVMYIERSWSCRYGNLGGDRGVAHDHEALKLSERGSGIMVMGRCRCPHSYPWRPGAWALSRKSVTHIRMISLSQSVNSWYANWMWMWNRYRWLQFFMGGNVRYRASPVWHGRNRLSVGACK